MSGNKEKVYSGSGKGGTFIELDYLKLEFYGVSR